MTLDGAVARVAVAAFGTAGECDTADLRSPISRSTTPARRWRARRSRATPSGVGRSVVTAFVGLVAALGGAGNAGAHVGRPVAREATPRSYHLCEITNGQVFSCGPWFQGKAVARHDGAFRSCEITNGQVFSCGSWYQGKAVVLVDSDR